MFVLPLLLLVALTSLADPGEPARDPTQATPGATWRLHQAAAARHLLAYLEERRADDLQQAEAHLAQIPLHDPDSLENDVDGTDHLVVFPLDQEGPFLSRIAAWLGDRAEARDWDDMPQFKALLNFLAKEDYRRLKHHLAEVAAAEEPAEAPSAQHRRGPEALSTALLIRTQRPDRWDLEHRLIAAFVGLRPGDRVADIGCSGGFFTFRFSAAVGPAGRVYAVDVSPEALEVVDSVGDAAPFPNVTTSLSTWTTNNLEDASVDVAFISNIFFDVEARSPEWKAEFYASVKRILRPGGRFVACDHENTYGGLPYAEALSRIRQAGFTIDASYAWPTICISARPRVMAQAAPRSPDTRPR